MKKLIQILVATAIALTLRVGAILAADGKKAGNNKQALPANTRLGEQIKWQVIATGGTKAASANYAMRGTAGQTAVGEASSENYGMSHGFWQETGDGGGCCILRGDMDHGGAEPIDIADPVY